MAKPVVGRYFRGKHPPSDVAAWIRRTDVEKLQRELAEALALQAEVIAALKDTTDAMREYRADSNWSDVELRSPEAIQTVSDLNRDGLWPE